MSFSIFHGFLALFVAWLIAYIGLQVMTIFRKYKMHNKEQVLFSLFRGPPSGSWVCHGMVLNKDGNEVVSDLKKSPAWYSRLI